MLRLKGVLDEKKLQYSNALLLHLSVHSGKNPNRLLATFS